MSFITELLFFQEGHITLLLLVGTTVLLSRYVRKGLQPLCHVIDVAAFRPQIFSFK